MYIYINLSIYLFFFKDTTPSIPISQRNKQNQKYNLTFPLAEVYTYDTESVDAQAIRYT